SPPTRWRSHPRDHGPAGPPSPGSACRSSCLASRHPSHDRKGVRNPGRFRMHTPTRHSGRESATRGPPGRDTLGRGRGGTVGGVEAAEAESVVVDPRSDARWRELALGQHGSVFTSPAWIDAVCGTYGFTPAASVRLDWDGTPRAGLAWVP